MTVRFSSGLRTKMCDGGVGGGIKGALNLGKIAIYSGPQPISADNAATGTLLGTVTVDGGATGLTFGAAANGVLAKTVGENWKFFGLVDGVAGWFRFYPAGGNPANASTSESRIDGSIATSGGDMWISSVSIVNGDPCTIDIFSITLPA